MIYDWHLIMLQINFFNMHWLVMFCLSSVDGSACLFVSSTAAECCWNEIRILFDTFKWFHFNAPGQRSALFTLLSSSSRHLLVTKDFWLWQIAGYEPSPTGTRCILYQTIFFCSWLEMDQLVPISSMTLKLRTERNW